MSKQSLVIEHERHGAAHLIAMQCPVYVVGSKSSVDLTLRNGERVAFMFGEQGYGRPMSGRMIRCAGHKRQKTQRTSLFRHDVEVSRHG